MQINTYENKVKTKEVSMTYADFQTTANSNTVDITSFTADQSIVGVDVGLTDAFGGIQHTLNYLNIGDDFYELVSGLNISANQRPEYENLAKNTNYIWTYRIDSEKRRPNSAFKNLVDYPFHIKPTAWSIGGDTITARVHATSVGTVSDAILFGGFHARISSDVSLTTEEYNGTVWINAAGNINSGRYGQAAAGTTSAALMCAGYVGIVVSTSSEEYDGTTWSAGGSMNTGRWGTSAAGTQTAALCVTGSTTSSYGGAIAGSEEYNGATWSSGGNSSYATIFGRTIGTQSAALNSGGQTSDTTTLSKLEEYNGAAFSNASESLIAVRLQGFSGIQTAAIMYGGAGFTNFYLTSSYVYDGSSWSATTNYLNIGRYSPGSPGTGYNTLAVVGAIEDDKRSSSVEVYDSAASASNHTISATVYSEGLRSWSVGPDMEYALRYVGGCGDQTAALCCGGNHASIGSMQTASEFDGTSWSQGGSTSSGHSECGATGNLLGALIIAGNGVAVTEEYNGSTWSTGGSLSQGNNGVGCFGTQGSAVAAGGYPGGSSFNTTEEYGGTAWSIGGNLITARRSNPAFGASRSGGTVTCGHTGSEWVNSTEEYNGDSWSSSTNSNAIITYGWGCGSTNSGLIHGGSSNPQEYENYTWTSTAYPSINRTQNGLAGSRSTAITFAGYGTERLFSSELYNVELPQIPVWSVTGGSVNTLRSWLGSCGTQSAGLEFGGWSVSGSAAVDYTNEYNGTAWIYTTDMSQTLWQLTGSGTQTAALHMCGSNTAGTKTATTEEYNGSVWSSGGNISTLVNAASACGTQSASLKIAGSPGTVISTVEEYNGASWSSGTGLNTARKTHGSAGSTTAALVTCGSDDANDPKPDEVWNDTAWSFEGYQNVLKYGHPGTVGVSNLALSAGGQSNTGVTDDVEVYNGTNWTTIGGLNLARKYHAAAGNTTAAVMAHGTDENFLIKSSENYDDPATNNLSNLTQGSITFTFKYIDYSGS